MKDASNKKAAASESGSRAAVPCSLPLKGSTAGSVFGCDSLLTHTIVQRNYGACFAARGRCVPCRHGWRHMHH